MNKYSADKLFKIAFNHLQKKNFGKSTGLFEKLINDYPENLSVLRNLDKKFVKPCAFRHILFQVWPKTPLTKANWWPREGGPRALLGPGGPGRARGGGRGGPGRARGKA